MHSLIKKMRSCLAPLLVMFFLLMSLAGLVDVPRVYAQGSDPVTTTSSDPIVQSITSGFGLALDGLKNVAGFLPGKALNVVINTIGNALLSFAALFTWMGGALFEGALQYTVVEMGTHFNGGLGVAVENSWKVVRDLCNLVFIFGFIYAGFMTIVDPARMETQRWIKNIIIGALLINFSLYFAKVIIDVSNIISVQIYNAIATTNASISEVLFQKLGVISLYNVPSISALTKLLTDDTSISFFLAGSIFLLIVAFVFFTVAILLISRFVGIILIMIASPLLFAAIVFPQTKKYADDLWKKLINYAFFVPVYLIMIFFALVIIDSLGLNQGSFVDTLIHTTDSETPSKDNITVILQFSIVIFLMWQATSIAEKAGIFGSNTVSGYVGRGLQRATGASWAAKKIADKQEEWRKAPVSGAAGWRGKVGGALKRSAAAGMRGTGIDSGVKAVRGAKFGSDRSVQSVDDEEKKWDRERAKTVQVQQTETGIRLGAQSTATPQQKIAMEQAIANANTDHLLTMLETFKTGSPERAALISNMSASQFENLMKVDADKLDDTEKTQIRTERATEVGNRLTTAGAVALNTVVGKASAKDLDALGLQTVLENAQHLSNKQINDMTLTPTAKQTIKNERETRLIAIAQGGTFDARGNLVTPPRGYTAAGVAAVFGMFTNSDERAQLPLAILKDVNSLQHYDERMLTKIPDHVSNTSDLQDIRTNIQGNAVTGPKFKKFWKTNAGRLYT